MSAFLGAVGIMHATLFQWEGGSPMLRPFTIAVLSLATVTLAVPRCEAQNSVPVRELSLDSAEASRRFGLILNVRQLAGGKVLVNDGSNRQLVVLDSSPSNPVVILDSVPHDGAGYGPRAPPLINYLGDSTIFVDGQSLSLLVISPHGTVARVMAAPSQSVVRALAGSSSAVDQNGDLIYRAVIYGIEKVQGPGLPTLLLTPDSAALMRATFETRQIDTIAMVKLANALRTEIYKNDDGSVRTHSIINPVSNSDEWAVLTDGSIALVRGYDYHIDWLRPDGTKTSTAKLPFDWKALSEQDKLAIIDSARTAEELRIANRPKPLIKQVPPRREIFTVGFVPLKEIPDFQPAIRPGAVKADLENNLWILPSTSAQSKNGELVYDVVSSAGELTHRVRVPLGYSIAGFGKQGIVYLMRKDGESWLLKRANVRSSGGS